MEKGKRTSMANTLLSLRDVYSFNNKLTHPNAIVFLTILNDITIKMQC